MFNKSKRLTVHERHERSLAQGLSNGAYSAAASSSSSSSSAPFVMPGQPRSEDVSSKRVMKRVRQPDNPDHPELDFLEDKSQTAFETEKNQLWLQTNGDFWTCPKHNQVCEMIKLHPDIDYDKECGCCLKSEKGGILRLFFAPDHDRLTIEQAEQAWLSYYSQLDKVQKEMTTNPEKYKTFTFAERAAWMRYWFLAWNQNRYRVRALKLTSDGQRSGPFNMLSNEADRSLVEFNENASKRHRSTKSGQIGNKWNVMECDYDTHGYGPGGEKPIGHAIQTLNKFRYKECGICVIPREKTQTDREFDQYNNDRSSKI